LKTLWISSILFESQLYNFIWILPNQGHLWSMRSPVPVSICVSLWVAKSYNGLFDLNLNLKRKKDTQFQTERRLLQVFRIILLSIPSRYVSPFVGVREFAGMRVFRIVWLSIPAKTHNSCKDFHLYKIKAYLIIHDDIVLKIRIPAPP